MSETVFERCVNPEGIQTFMFWLYHVVLFERCVNPEGIQTSFLEWLM